MLHWSNLKTIHARLGIICKDQLIEPKAAQIPRYFVPDDRGSAGSEDRMAGGRRQGRTHLCLDLAPAFSAFGVLDWSDLTAGSTAEADPS